MEVKEIEITKKEKIYTFTESELEDLKCEARAYGSKKTRGYVHFCFLNYRYKTDSVGGLCEFLKDLAPFLAGYDYIPNVYKWGLYDWLDKNKE